MYAKDTFLIMHSNDTYDNQLNVQQILATI
jgi:hypothetical protein